MIGNIANEPESRTTQSGIAQCSFRLAVQRRFTNANGEREADFIQIVTWRKTAELCQKYLAKGRKVCVEGSIQVRYYEAQDGSKRYVTEVIADNVEFLSSRGEGGQNGAQSATAASDAQGFTQLDETDDSLPF